LRMTGTGESPALLYPAKGVPHMRSQWSGACGAVAAIFLVCAGPGFAQRIEASRVQDATDVFHAITSVPDYQVPAALMKNAYGIAVIPRVQRVSFIVGIQRGRGVLVARGNAGWSRPLFISLTGGSVGWQAGVQSADIVLFFRTRDSVEQILRGGSTLGVTASIAAGAMGREASAFTDADLQAEVYSYSRTRGIFAGIALQGGALNIDYDANAAYYGKDIARAEQIFQGAGLPDPATAVQLRQEITTYEKAVR
jgi:lipid-binding SYLF domain-containing protein